LLALYWGICYLLNIIVVICFSPLLVGVCFVEGKIKKKNKKKTKARYNAGSCTKNKNKKLLVAGTAP
jgi:hypothetical protein